MVWRPSGPIQAVGAEGRDGTGVALMLLARPHFAQKAPALSKRESPPVSSTLTTPPTVEPAESNLDLAADLDAFVPSVADAAPGSPCDLASAFARDLNGSPAARAALEAVPPATRSVANAIMLWDGGWGPDADGGGRGLLRQILIREIQASRSDCRDERHQGPVLFLAAAEGGAVSVVVGSGVWRWSDLVR